MQNLNLLFFLISHSYHKHALMQQKETYVLCGFEEVNKKHADSIDCHAFLLFFILPFLCGNVSYLCGIHILKKRQQKSRLNIFKNGNNRKPFHVIQQVVQKVCWGCIGSQEHYLNLFCTIFNSKRQGLYSAFVLQTLYMPNGTKLAGANTISSAMVKMGALWKGESVKDNKINILV